MPVLRHRSSAASFDFADDHLDELEALSEAPASRQSGGGAPKISGEYRVEPTRKSSTANLRAVRPTFSSAGSYASFDHEALGARTTRMLDDDLGFDDDADGSIDVAMDLDLPDSHPKSRRSVNAMKAVRPASPPPSTPSAPSTPSTRSTSETSHVFARPTTYRSVPRMQAVVAPPVDPYAAVVAFAGFGEAPASVWAKPAYAFHVLSRRRVLKRGLAAARKNGSKDVGLYEAALRSSDDDAVRAGLAFSSVLAGLISLLLFAATEVFRNMLAMG